MSRIIDVFAMEVLDSRSNPTVEVTVLAESGAIGSAIWIIGFGIYSQWKFRK